MNARSFGFFTLAYARQFSTCTVAASPRSLTRTLRLTPRTGRRTVYIPPTSRRSTFLLALSPYSIPRNPLFIRVKAAQKDDELAVWPPLLMFPQGDKRRKVSPGATARARGQTAPRHEGGGAKTRKEPVRSSAFPPLSLFFSGNFAEMPA